MPTLAQYERLAPFSLAELVEAANSILRERPRLHVSDRTVRYYISKGILAPPHGTTKAARYSFEHLTRLVNARLLIDSGASLEEAKKSAGNLEEARKANWEELRNRPVAMSAPSFVREEPSVAYAVRTVRIPLGPRATLEVNAEGSILEALETARTEMQHLNLAELAKSLEP